MDHSEVIRLSAAEKYLLGELARTLREEYEEHCFSCPECALDLKAGAAFMDAGRDLARTEAASKEAAARATHRTLGWFAWLRPKFAVPALVLLLALTAYQNLVTIPGLKNGLSKASAAQALASFSLITQSSRGVTPAKLNVPPQRPFGLFVDIPPEDAFQVYTCEIVGELGNRKFSVQVSKEQAKKTVQLLIPASKLTPGTYELVIRGAGRPGPEPGANGEIARYRFTLEYTK